VEHPKINSDLRLLMLMHQRLEEAQVLGHAEPRLEYREGSSGQTIHAVVGGLGGTPDYGQESAAVCACKSRRKKPSLPLSTSTSTTASRQATG
jgi:hypothetical protein